MIKKILFLLIFILLITSCTHEKDIFKIKREKKKDKNYEVIYPEFTGIDTEVITKLNKDIFAVANKSLDTWKYAAYRDWETDRKSTRLNSSHRSLSRMPSSA